MATTARAKAPLTNDLRTLKTYRRRGIVHVCLSPDCAGLPKGETALLEDARIRVMPLIDTRVGEPRGAIVELPDGALQVWPMIDRKTLARI